MGIGGISIWQLLIILVIIVLIFGTKKLRSMGSDLGGAVKGFKKAITEEDKEKEPEKIDESDTQATDLKKEHAAENSEQK